VAHFNRSSSRRSFGAPASSAKTKSWALGPKGNTATISSATAVVFGTAAQAVVDGLTILRIRGELLIYLVTTDAADSGFQEIAFGMGIVSENAAGIGVTALPAPIGDIGWDGWMYYQTFALLSVDAVSASSVSHSGSNPMTSALRIPIDGKAMRKIKNTDTLVAVLETSVEAGTATLEAQLNTRILTLQK